jgi:D-serine deaminase-like pyridoxal phosphate-dependent protein
MKWFEIEGIDNIDSPSIVLYEERLDSNLKKMLEMADNDASKLMPHVKTNKMPKVIRKMISLGITNFKASTIAEAEMAAREGASSVLIAHQLVGPKIQRFANLCIQFPKTEFTTIVDNNLTLKNLHTEAQKKDISISFYIDINNGMNRTGIEIGPDLHILINQVKEFKNLYFKGLHVYDGHLRNSNFTDRKDLIEKGFISVNSQFEKLKLNNSELKLISGGTPSFTTHLRNESRICSPGTCVLWDWGYSEILVEQEFKFAALLISRVISKPTMGIITIDLGHKAVAAENSIDKRVRFLNISNYKLLSQSEEHGVIQIENWENIQVGDVIYGIPYHICPTINLYDTVSVIRDGKKIADWSITARQRKITI